MVMYFCYIRALHLSNSKCLVKARLKEPLFFNVRVKWHFNSELLQLIELDSCVDLISCQNLFVFQYVIKYEVSNLQSATVDIGSPQVPITAIRVHDF